MSTPGPVEFRIRDKLTEALAPATLDIVNESHLHANHAAMQGVQSQETHFRVTVVSSAFAGQDHLQRHRKIYGLLDDEIRNHGVHALSIRARTPEEAIDA